MPLPSIRAGPTRSALIGDEGEPRPGWFLHEIRAPFQGAPLSRRRMPYLINTRRPEHVNPPPDA